MARSSTPRIEPVTDPSDEALEVLAKTILRDGEPLNIFGVLAHHPKLLKRFNLLGGLLLNRGVVPLREKEVVILRIGWNAQSVYEFGQHTLIGRERGLTDDEIVALTRDPAGHDWSDDDRALIALADDLSTDDCASDATWAALASRWNDDALIELLMIAGFYRLVSGFLNSAGVQLDEGVPGWPQQT